MRGPAAPAGAQHFPEARKPGAPEREAFDSGADSLRYHEMERAPHGRGAPAGRYFAALEHARRMPAYSIGARRFVSREADLLPHTSGRWEFIGPDQAAGRIRALVIDPQNQQTMYAGAASGGVWKTTDGGKNWTPLTDAMPNLKVASLAMDSANSQTLYAGTGEWWDERQPRVPTDTDFFRGAGILKTTDGGATWSRLSATTGSGFYYVNKIVVSPNSSSHVYAATWDGVFRSLDAGASWQLVLDRQASQGCQDLVIRSDQKTDWLFASCLGSPQGTILRNQDAGGSGTWEPVLSVDYMHWTAMALAPSNQSVVYALMTSNEPDPAKFRGMLAVYRSQQNGDSGSWQMRASNRDSNILNTLLLSNAAGVLSKDCMVGTINGCNQGDWDDALAVDPQNPDVVWAGGIDLFRSDDGGANWGVASYWWPQPCDSSCAGADHHALVFAKTASGGKALLVAGDQGVFITTNSDDRVGTSPEAPFFPFDSSVSWSNVNGGTGASLGVTQFYAGAVYPGGHAYFGGAQDNGTLRGADSPGGGSQWARINGGDGGYVAIDPTDANIIYMEWQFFNLEKSVDGGNTLTPATQGIREPPQNFFAISPFAMDPDNPKRLWTGGHTLWITENGAQSWTAASGPISDTAITAIAISPKDGRHALAGNMTGTIFSGTAIRPGPRGHGTSRSNPGWHAAQPRSGFVSSIVFDPKNPRIAYASYLTFNAAAGDHHVYKTTDDGYTWAPADGSGATGLPDVPVDSLLIDRQSSSTLYAGTDLGIFVSLDGGATWAQDQSGLPNTEVMHIVQDAASGAIFAFTYGRGVWRLQPTGTPACTYTVNPTKVTLDVLGEPVTVTVDTSPGCAWSAVPNGVPAAAGIDQGGSWIEVSSPAGGTGRGTVQVSAGSNSVQISARSGSILIANQIVAVSQPGLVTANPNAWQLASAEPITQAPYVGMAISPAPPDNSSYPVHSCTGKRDINPIWYRLTAPASGRIQITAAGGDRQSGADTGSVLTAYAGGTAPGAELACATAAAGADPTWASASLTVAQGKSYLIELSGAGGSSTGGLYVIVVEYSK